MKDHQKRELVDALTKVAVAFAGAQQLRDRIAQLVLPALAVQKAEIAAMRQDAERYRWLRDNSRKWSWMPSQFNPEIISGFCCDGADYQGYAFDAAMAQVVQP